MFLHHRDHIPAAQGMPHLNWGERRGLSCRPLFSEHLGLDPLLGLSKLFAYQEIEQLSLGHGNVLAIPHTLFLKHTH